MELDINLRVRIHELEKALEEKVRSFPDMTGSGFSMLLYRWIRLRSCRCPS